jgi:glycosyltransferase involved in cell wall biosynthesis
MTSKKEARIALGLPEKSQLVVYTGHLYSWKGVDTLVSSASMIPEVRVFLVGGTDSDIAKYREMYKEIKNLFIAGHRPHQEIPLWQRAADILILPNTGKENISKYYTSPMKLFEYMASKTPIIASRIPSITEILNDDNSLLVEPDSPTELATAINKIMCDNSLGKKYSEQAFADVRKHSWNERAKRILGFLNEVM